jgi:hypothetical protein
MTRNEGMGKVPLDTQGVLAPHENGDQRSSRGHRGRHARKEYAVKAWNHSGVA